MARKKNESSSLQEPKKPKTKHGKEKQTLSKEEKDNLDSLYRHVKIILGFDDNTPLPREYVLRLKGLQVGKFIQNYHVEAVGSDNEYGEAGYVSFAIIHRTLKTYLGDILAGFRRNNITDSKYKLYYMCKVIEGHLQDTIDQIKREEQAEKVAEQTVDEGVLSSELPDYQPKTKKDNAFLSDLWK